MTWPTAIRNSAVVQVFAPVRPDLPEDDGDQQEVNDVCLLSGFLT
jgi:hypothetical protein